MIFPSRKKLDRKLTPIPYEKELLHLPALCALSVILSIPDEKPTSCKKEVGLKANVKSVKHRNIPYSKIPSRFTS